MYIFEHGNFLEYVDKVYLIDGRYKGRGDSPEHDPNLTYAILNKYKEKILYIHTKDKTQIEKRNMIYDLAERHNDDYLIWLDSDEFIEFDAHFWQGLVKCEDINASCFPITSWSLVTPMPRPRLFKKPFNFRHRQLEDKISHGSLWSDYGIGNEEIIHHMYRWIVKYSREKGVDGIKVTHRKDFRTPDRVKRDYVYYADNPTR